MAPYDPLAFGCSLRAHRLKLGWSANQLSELYAEFVGREIFRQPGIHLPHRARRNDG